MADFHPLSIIAIVRETPKAVVLTFQVPDALKSDFTFESGQYVTLKTTIAGEEVRRAYSICSSPTESTISVVVKELKGGTFSTYVNHTLLVGDTMEVHPPEGKFILKATTSEAKTYGAFAAGSGITPIMSMIRHNLETAPSCKFVLVYGNRTPEETIFLDELKNLQQEHPDQLSIEFLYSQLQVEGARFGRVERSTVNYVLKNKYKDVDFAAFYLCGPEAMIHTVTDVLQEGGIAKDQIYFELFTAATKTEVPTAILDGQTAITILVDDEETAFTMDQKTTILDAALEKDLDAPYSCQGGVCSSCICRITEGKALMDTNTILTESELEEGLVLACQAHPVTATIFVDFDDV